jgi:YidC/Oxa1 family membrane protein insertase
VNTGKAITFIFLSSAIMMTALLLQGMFGEAPKKGPVDQPADVALNDSQEDPANLDLNKDFTPAEKGDQTQDQSDQSTEKPSEPSTPKATEEKDPKTNEAKDDEKPDATTRPIAKDEFVTIGSLNPDGSSRYLITANKRGATLRRVELNFRDASRKDRRYKYRDIVFEGGYIGELDCTDTPKGLLVRTVGNGTPAGDGGVLVGDIIVSLNSESIVNEADWQEVLETKTKPGDTVELVVKRNGQNKTLGEIQLTTKPIELMRPEPGWVDPTFDYPESFVFSVIQPHAELGKAWPDLDAEMRDGNWELVPTGDPMEIQFEFTLDEQTLEKFELKGPIVVRKKYRLPDLNPETIDSLDSRTFHIKFDLEVENKADVAQKLAFELDGPTGIPAETWWYGYKIHGRQTAIGSIGGARDIVGSTEANSYVFWGCPEIVSGAKKKTPKVNYICDWSKTDEKERQLYWAGVDAHYFNIALIPDLPEGQSFTTNSVSAFLNGTRTAIPKIPDNVRVQKLMDVTFQMTAPLEIGPGGTYKQSFDVFCGPKEVPTLAQYGLDDVRTFGWFSWCSWVLVKVLHFFYWITGNFSYGLAIIMLTVLVRCIMIPFSRKAALNAQMMAHLQPEMKEIAERHKDNMEKRAAAQRELYKKHNFNPFGGCFMMFFQLPIFYGLYKALNVDIALRDQPLFPGMSWCSNLAAPDRLMDWQNWMPFGLGEEASWLGPYLNILPIATMILFIAQQKLFTPPPTDDQQKMMQKMMTFMMLAMGFMFFKFPSGLCLYFITSSLWAIVERKMLPKPVLDTSKLSVSDMSPKEAKKVETKRKAEFDRKEAEAMDRKQRNADRKKRLKQRGN